MNHLRFLSGARAEFRKSALFQGTIYLQTGPRRPSLLRFQAVLEDDYPATCGSPTHSEADVACQANTTDTRPATLDRGAALTTISTLRPSRVRHSIIFVSDIPRN